MGRVTSYGTKGTELGATLVDRLYAPSAKPAVIFCHGLNGLPWHPVAFPDPVIDLLVARGYPVSSHALGGTATWGNDAAQTKIGDARTYMQSAPVNALAGPVLLYAGSMGALAALNYARANPANVLAVAGALPANDLADLYTNAPLRTGDAAGFPASIDAAYGGTMDATERAAHSPAEHAAEYASLDPVLGLWYSTDDLFVDPDTVTDFATAAGAETHSLGAVGHTFPAEFAEDVADFLGAYA